MTDFIQYSNGMYGEVFEVQSPIGIALFDALAIPAMTLWGYRLFAGAPEKPIGSLDAFFSAESARAAMDAQAREYMEGVPTA